MQLVYEGKDIAQAVEINRADVTDNAGGVADSLELWFNDPLGWWSQWQPEKNHTVEVIRDGYSSGIMFIDELEQQRGRFVIRALSIPQEARTKNTRSWENIRFLILAGEIAAKYGFALETYGITNHLYERVDQQDMADFEFLAFRCMLEGYLLKLYNKKVVIYDSRYIEGQAPVREMDMSGFDGEYRFRRTSTGIYGSCRLTYGSIWSECKANAAGPVLKISSIPVYSQDEADRFAKGMLRYHNCRENTGACTIPFDSGIAAGCNINITGVGLADGKYFCEKIVHRLVDGKTFQSMYKPLEGY